MKKSLWILSALALAGFCMTGCLEGLDEPEAGDVVNNDEYCDSQCGASEYCILGDDLKTGECSPCNVDCARVDALYPVCVVIQGAGECVAKATCPEGQDFDFDKDLDHYVCSGGTVVEPEPQVGSGLFIRVDDMSSLEESCGGLVDGKCKKDDPGADIDTIVVKKKSGGFIYVKEVKEFGRVKNVDRLSDRPVSSDPKKLEGEPDSLITYPEKGQCYYLKKDSNKDDYDFTFASLGGMGGYVVVEMKEAFHAGDTVDVIELGDCELTNLHDSDGTVSKSNVGAETMKVQVSVSGADGSWQVLGDAGKAAGGIFTAGTITDSMLK